MRATVKFVKERFDFFNKSIFSGTLPDVRLRVSSSIRTLGTLRHPRERKPETGADEITLSISNRLDFEPRVIEDTIIHEMVHLYIFWHRISDSSAHGTAFRKIAAHINRHHARNIKISHRSNEEEKKSDRLHKPRVVIVSQLHSGERVVTVCMSQYVISLYRQLMKSNMVDKIQVIASYDPTFAHYPASRTPKLYKIDSGKLDEILRDATFFEWRDGRFSPKVN